MLCYNTSKQPDTHNHRLPLLTMRTELDAIITCLLWTMEADEATITDQDQKKLLAEWEWFVDKADALGFDAWEHRTEAINSAEGDEADYAAHDWVLTRNGHGAGFWDGGWEKSYGDKLTELCRQQGEIQAIYDETANEVYLA